MTHAQHVVYVWVTHMPMDLVSLVGTFLSLVAVAISLITVRQNSSALRNAQDQTRQLQRALVRPAVRVSRSAEALKAIEQRTTWEADPDYSPERYPMYVAITNIGLGRAVSLSPSIVEGHVIIVTETESARFLVSANDLSLLALTIDLSHHKSEGVLTLQIEYKDVLGYSYRYTCKFRYDYSIKQIWTMSESDEDLPSTFVEPARVGQGAG